MGASRKVGRDRRKLEAIAYHEAGHAVACIELERPFEYVTIVAKDDTLGHVTKKLAPTSIRPDCDLSTKTERWLEREIMVTLAGLPAECRFMGRNNWRGAHSDIQVAIDLASYLYPPGTKLLDKYLTFMVERARSFVSHPKNWLRIETLAAALLNRPTLSAKEAKELCRQSLLDAVNIRRYEALILQAQAREKTNGLAVDSPN